MQVVRRLHRIDNMIDNSSCAANVQVIRLAFPKIIGAAGPAPTRTISTSRFQVNIIDSFGSTC